MAKMGFLDTFRSNRLTKHNLGAKQTFFCGKNLPIDLQKIMARTRILEKNSDFFTNGLILVIHIIYQLLVMIWKLLHHLEHPIPSVGIRCRVRQRMGRRRSEGGNIVGEFGSLDRLRKSEGFE